MTKMTFAFLWALTVLLCLSANGETNVCEYLAVPDLIDAIRVNASTENDPTGTNRVVLLSIVDKPTIAQISSLLRSVKVEGDEKVPFDTRGLQKWRLVMVSRNTSNDTELGGVAVPRTVVVDIVGETVLDRKGNPLNRPGNAHVLAIRELLQNVRSSNLQKRNAP